MQQDYGQRAFAILLFQDMSVVPLLALVPLMASAGEARAHVSMAETASSAALIAAAIAALVLAGRYLLNPFFRLLAWTGAREVMTAAALLIVLGAALLMQVVGMSMALGAFLAGVLLAESTYRHELEADIEPFRGLLLALFFMGVGMTIDLKIVWANLALVIGAARHHHAAQGGRSCGRCSASPAPSAATRCAPARCSPARANSPSCCCRSRPGSASLGDAGQPPFGDRRDHLAARSAVREPRRRRAAPLRAPGRARSRRFRAAPAARCW